MALRGRHRGGGRARGRVAALRAETPSLHGGAEAKAAALRAAEAVMSEVAEAVVVAPKEGLAVGHAVKLCGPCGSAYEGDSTPGWHAAAVRRTLTFGWAATFGDVEFSPLSHAAKLRAPSGSAYEGDSTPG